MVSSSMMMSARSALLVHAKRPSASKLLKPKSKGMGLQSSGDFDSRARVVVLFSHTMACAGLWSMGRKTQSPRMESMTTQLNLNSLAYSAAIGWFTQLAGAIHEAGHLSGDMAEAY